VEREKVELAAECCREILHHVNQAVRDMEDLLVSWTWPLLGRGVL
jgi:Rho guanine nucleotide exchange factor 1